MWPHIGNAYCYSTLQAEAVCTATALSRPAATAQKGEKYATRRAVLHLQLPACPQTQIVLLWRKDQNIQINNLQPSKGCTHMLGFKALTLGRGSRHFGEMFYSRLLHPALRPTKSGQQYWRLHLVKSCQGPHTFSRFIHFYSLKKKCTKCEAFR